MNSLLIAGAVALILSLIGYSVLIAMENLVLSKYDRVSVYILNTDVAKGTQITDSGIFQLKSVDADVVPDGAITNLSDIKDCYIKYDVSANSIVTKSMFQNMEEVINGTHEIGIAMADLTGSVNGILRASNYIDIYIIPDDYGKETYSSKKEEDETTVQNTLTQTEDGNDNTSYIIDGEVVNADNIGEALEKSDYDSSRPVANKSDKVQSLEPTYKRVYVSKVFDDSGVLISNDDESTIASRFNIIMSDDDCNYLMGALQTGHVYVVLCREEQQAQ